MIEINKHAHVAAPGGAGLELFIDATVTNPTTGEKKTRRIGGRYHATLSSALNSYVENYLRSLAADEEMHPLKEVAEDIRELKSKMTEIYSQHILHENQNPISKLQADKSIISRVTKRESLLCEGIQCEGEDIFSSGINDNYPRESEE